ncbi:hypothetical protein SUGI_0011320 [Cryptomeria japonica]|uniref:uncharacterized protein LOC131041923 n=1 Tax=Cryptomeria japonica TaxID=3369 RepID=UPI002408A00D|nr:uncharacterized protein LOC131041923 [Cryptomeria japonica]GLJ05105.1 hypothetical protein SUGI_0011320 [Cryptomeria japonica]
MAATGRTPRKKQSARAKSLPSELTLTFLEPDAKWVRSQWPQLPEHSSAKINLINAGLDKYLQTPLLPLDVNLLKHAVSSFDGSGIPFDKNGYVRIDPQTVSAVTGLPASGDSVDMSLGRRRVNSPGGRARVALEICGSDKAFGSKGIRVDLIRPVELRWAAAVLTSRVFGQQKGEYLNLGHFNLVKMVSVGHKFNWAEYVALRIKEKLRKIQGDGKGCFYMGTVLTGLIYDQVPHLGPKGGICLVEERPSLMKWASLCPKKERGCLSVVKQETIEGPASDGELEPGNDEKPSCAGGMNGNAEDSCALKTPNSRNGKLALPWTGYDTPPTPSATPSIGNGAIDGPEKISFSQLLQKQVLLSTSGASATGVAKILACSQDLANSGKSLCLDIGSQRSDSQPSGHHDEPSAMMEVCSVSDTGTGSPRSRESPKPRSSEVANEVAEKLESPRSVRKRALSEREEEISSKRRRLLESRPLESLLAVPLQQMAVGENLMLFKLVFDEVEKRLQTATEECEWWKSCAQGLCKHLDQHFAGLPIKQSHWQQILNEEPIDSVEMHLSRAYIKKAAKIIKEQETEIQNFKVTEENTKKLESANLALMKDLEMEQQYRKSAEACKANLESQLVQFKSKEEDNIRKLESANLALKKDSEMAQQHRATAEARAAQLESQLVQFKKKLHRVLED